MSRDEALTHLKAIEPDLRALGVGGLSIYGSVARDEARRDLVHLTQLPLRRRRHSEQRR